MRESSAKKDKIFAEHPRGKKGVWIDAVKYNLMKNAITKSLKGRELTHAELFSRVQKSIGLFSGSVSWYMETVKLDLESKKIVERISRGRNTFYRIINL